DAATATAPRGRRARKAAAQPASQAPLSVTSAEPSDGATLISHDEDDGVADATMHHLARTAHQLTLTLIVVGSVAVLAILALVLSRTVDQFKPAPTLVTQTATVHVTATATPVTLATDGGFAANAVSDVRFGTVVLPASQTIVSSRWGPEQADTQLQSGTEILIGLLGSATPTPGAVTVAPSTAPAQAPATPTTTVNTYPYGIPTPASTLSAAARRWITTQDGATIDRGGSGMRTMTSGYTAWCARSSSQPDRTGEGCFYPTQGGISFIWVWTPPAVTDDIRATLLNSYVPGF
ncbi:MAG: hypothetical protein FWF75_09030, partial [Propionibacteriaceae bacterium]|nr:hypothetical protein [Propionibacteriaceae bacterium]